MKHLDLFSGIGGFSIAAQSVWGEEWESAGFCDIEPFSQIIIKKHYPNAKIYSDIKTLKGSELGTVDLVTGGFPCQPFSAAGKRRGTADDRHLWPEMLRIIRETRPRWIVGENVAGLITWGNGLVLEGVLADLEAAGYTTLPPLVIPAVAINAPHRRDRIWIIAYANGDGPGRYSGLRTKEAKSSKTENKIRQRQRVRNNSCRVYSDTENTTNTSCSGRKRKENDGDRERYFAWRDTGYWLEAATELCTLDDGLPNGSPRPRGWRNAALKGAGNAIVPQVAAQIFKAIKEVEKDNLLSQRDTTPGAIIKTGEASKIVEQMQKEIKKANQ